eukprot:323182-Prorocentrum_minimum.AAC.1
MRVPSDRPRRVGMSARDWPGRTFCGKKRKSVTLRPIRRTEGREVGRLADRANACGQSGGSALWVL